MSRKRAFSITRVPDRGKSGAGWCRGALLLTCFAVIWSSTATAQTSDEINALRKELEALRQAQAALEKEVAEIKEILQSMLTPPQSAADNSGGSAISIAGLPTRGRPTARVTIVEFSDYQCIHCARFFLEVYPEIDRDFILPGGAQYVFKNFPVEAAHPEAFKAHEAAACAGDQGKYWEMHDTLFANQTSLGRQLYVSSAQSLGLDSAAFRTCLDSGKHAAMIRRDIEEATRGGVQGTPLFAIGLTEPGSSSLKVRRVVIGAPPYSVFKEAIEAVSAMAQEK
jgi:protein-disulfide isomerase